MSDPTPQEMRDALVRSVRRYQTELQAKVKADRRRRRGSKHAVGDTRPTVAARTVERRAASKRAKASRRRNR